MKKTLLALFAVGLIVFGGYLVMSGRLGVTQAPPVFTLEGKQLEYVLTAERDGQTALELLQASEQVELSIYEFGSLVKSIDNLAVNDAYYWAFYVNGEYAQQAADKTVLAVGDKVEFKYEKIEAFPTE
ncbi:MAG TPA: DUF4430 domain-containing protein [Candidatus Woesebacteria bacterium]|nr:DUF4430 domain-containing protein [Candidatus Woesebacteria bacterium]